MALSHFITTDGNVVIRNGIQDAVSICIFSFLSFVKLKSLIQIFVNFAYSIRCIFIFNKSQVADIERDVIYRLRQQDYILPQCVSDAQFVEYIRILACTICNDHISTEDKSPNIVNY